MSGAGQIPERRQALLADLSLVLVTAIWGSTFVVNRLVLESTPPLLFLILRFGLGGLLLWLLSLGRPRTPGLFRDGAVIGALLAVGIGCQIVGQLFTSASKAAFVTGLSVPLTPIVGFLATRKLPTRENVAGLVLAATGFAILSWPKDAAGVNVGDLLILGTAVSYAYLIVYMADAAPRHDARWFSTSQILFGALGVVAVRLALTPFLHHENPFFAAERRALTFTPSLVLAILWMAVMATVVTFVVQTWAQARMSATHAAIVFALEPVFTALFAALFLKERLGAREVAGAVLVLLGIVVSELPSRR